MTSLAELQHAMREALHEGNPGPVLARLVGTTTRTAAEQLAVYEGMYFARQAEALAQDYPQVVARLGAELFARVAVTHVKRCPSRHPSLAFLGRGLDVTLVGLGLDAEASVARLEGARNEAFWAPDRDPLAASALGALGEGLAAAVLLFHPSLQVVSVSRSARAAVEGPALAGPGTEEEEEEEEQSVAVWRQGHTVVHEVVPPLVARALACARAGASVAEVFELFLGEESPESAAFEALLGWVSRGWIVGASVRGPASAELA